MGTAMAWRLGFGALCVLVGPGCEWTPETFSGLTSLIRVQGGQAMRGSIAEPVSTSSAVATVVPRNAVVFPGASDRALTGVVGPNANAAALGVAGDTGYWRVPALSPDANNVDSFSFSATLAISPTAASSPLLHAGPEGTWTLPLSVRAVDNAGNLGPTTIQPFVFDAPAISGTLAVSLAWDTPADLDLHVLVPANNERGHIEVWARRRSADTSAPDGTLDFDSNAGCHIDARGLENVIWQGSPPTGHYLVRVAAASLCGLDAAAFAVYASVPGVSKGWRSGLLTEAAEREPVAEGAGLTVLEFDYP